MNRIFLHGVFAVLAIAILISIQCTMAQEVFGGPRPSPTIPINQSPPNRDQLSRSPTRANEIDYGPYMANLHRILSRLHKPAWNCQSPKHPVVIFRIHRDGHISDLCLARSSGNEKCDDEALERIKNNAPYPPPPAGSNESIEIQFTF